MSPARIVRSGFAASAMTLGAAGLITGEPRALAAGGMFGILWTFWDLLIAWIVMPLWDLLADILQGGGGIARGSVNLRPTLDDTIRYLHNHIARDSSRAVDVQSALRLEEIYRTIKKNPDKGRAVLEQVLARYPGDRALGERLRLYEELS